MRRADRLQVGVAREARLDRLQPARCLQQRRDGVFDASQVQVDLPLQAPRERALALVERSVAHGSEERRRGVRGPGDLLRFGGREHTPRARHRIGRQRGRALEEGGRGREAAACLCAVGRALELDGDILVRPVRGAGAVPRAPVGIPLCVGRLGERAVDSVAVVDRGRVVRRGAGERMRELDAPGDVEQSGVHRRAERRHVKAEDRGGTLQQHGVA